MGGITVPVKANVAYPKRVTGQSYFDYGTGSGAVTANRTYFNPVFLTEARSIASLCINVTAGIAGNVRLGVYSDNNGQPGTLLYTAGTATTNTAGVKSIALGQTLPAGVYWLAAQFDAAPSVSYRVNADLTANNRDMMGCATAWGANPTSSYRMSTTYASGLPATASGLTELNAGTGSGCQTGYTA